MEQWWPFSYPILYVSVREEDVYFCISANKTVCAAVFGLVFWVPVTGHYMIGGVYFWKTETSLWLYISLENSFPIKVEDKQEA